MLHDIYDHLRQRGLTTSERHFSTVWCGRAANYLSDASAGRLSPATGIELCRRLLRAKQMDLANGVMEYLIYRTSVRLDESKQASELQSKRSSSNS